MGYRYPIHVFGEPVRRGYTVISDELIRVGAHHRNVGSDGLALIALLLSRASVRPGQKAWETSAKQISEELGWGRNRDRARAAIDKCIEKGRLVKRTYVRDGQEVQQRCAYVVCYGGRAFTDEELLVLKEPIVLPPLKSRGAA